MGYGDEIIVAVSPIYAKKLDASGIYEPTIQRNRFWATYYPSRELSNEILKVLLLSATKSVVKFKQVNNTGKKWWKPTCWICSERSNCCASILINYRWTQVPMDRKYEWKVWTGSEKVFKWIEKRSKPTERHNHSESNSREWFAFLIQSFFSSILSSLMISLSLKLTCSLSGFQVRSFRCCSLEPVMSPMCLQPLQHRNQSIFEKWSSIFEQMPWSETPSLIEAWNQVAISTSPRSYIKAQNFIYYFLCNYSQKAIQMKKWTVACRKQNLLLQWKNDRVCRESCRKTILLF